MQAKNPLECDFSATWHHMSPIVISESPWMTELSYWKPVITGKEPRAWTKLVVFNQVGITLVKARSFFAFLLIFWKYIKCMYFSLSFCFDNNTFILLHSKYLGKFQYNFFCVLWIIWGGGVSEFSIAWIFNIYLCVCVCISCLIWL